MANNEYIVQRDSLVNVADEIRVLSGTTEELGLEEMASNVAEANDTIDAQATTISEIAALLEGKSVPGSGAGVETCTVTVTGDNSSVRPTYISATVLDDNGDISSYAIGNNSNQSVTINNVVIGSVVSTRQDRGMTFRLDKAELLITNGVYFNAFKITASRGETATIIIQDGNGSG